MNELFLLTYPLRITTSFSIFRYSYIFLFHTILYFRQTTESISEFLPHQDNCDPVRYHAGFGDHELAADPVRGMEVGIVAEPHFSRAYPSRIGWHPWERLYSLVHAYHQDDLVWTINHGRNTVAYSVLVLKEEYKQQNNRKDPA